MSDRSLQHSREELAKLEVGHTKIGRWTAWLLVTQFLLLVGLVPLSEIIFDYRNPGAADNLRNRLATLVAPHDGAAEPARPFFSQIVSRNRALIRELERFEEEAEDVSLLAQRLRPPTQNLLITLGAGTEQVYIGRTPWLFYREGTDYITGPGFLEPRRLAKNSEPNDLGDRRHPDPRDAILQLKAQLDERGIGLIVLPTPVKPTVCPEHFASGYQNREEPLRSPSYASFVNELEQRGVLVFDPAPAILEAKRRTGAPQYLMTDTHWRPETVELAAAHLRDFIIRHADLPSVPAPGYTSEYRKVTNLGDVAGMLGLPKQQARYPVEEVGLRQIRAADRSFWQPDHSADVLLLGDSFSNIYSLADMGWGESAGLAEQLSFVLQRPIDRMVRNADGAFATRELLARELASGSDRLEGKRLVIFQFAERELAVGDWKLVDLSFGEVVPGRFFVPDAGDEVLVSGTIREIAPIPRPGSVPYADHITAVHLVDLASEQVEVSGSEALVYLWGMRDNVLQEAARFRAGDTISARLRPWADVADQYDSISRTELGNVEVQFERPTWGEVENE